MNAAIAAKRQALAQLKTERAEVRRKEAVLTRAVRELSAEIANESRREFEARHVANCSKRGTKRSIESVVKAMKVARARRAGVPAKDLAAQIGLCADSIRRLTIKGEILLGAAR